MEWLQRFAVAIVLSSAACGHATTLPEGFEDAIFAAGITNATAMEFAPDGRLFVCEQGGALRVISHGSLLATPILSLTVDSSGERGLLGVAFDPDYPSNHWFYVYHTVLGSPAHNRISRYTETGDASIVGTEFVLVDLDSLSGATNHNGGGIHFGADGKLYIGVGENANSANSQTLNNRLGKILRLNRDGTIPTDNPFYASAAGANRAIWAMGLRNPFTFAFHPRTGRLFIDDVGQNTWEEIDDGIAGSNYGWPNAEGFSTNTAYRNPLYVYNHTSGDPTGCAITGGTFYAPDFHQFPQAYQDTYFYADYCAGWIWNYNPATNAASLFASGLASSTVDLDIGPDGSLYYLEHGTGGAGYVGRIRYTTGVYGLPDAVTALRIAAGLQVATLPQISRLNVKDSPPSTGLIDISDAVRIANAAAG